MKELDRRSLLLGAVAGIIVGGAGGVIYGLVHGSAAVAAPSGAPPAPSSSSAQVLDALALENVKSQAHPSFAQQGEDRVIGQIMQELKVRSPTYLDIGAHEPIKNSNTYMFYLLGGHGVLVEPNPTYAQKLRSVRPEDTVLEVGVGLNADAEADYYVMGGDGQLNTFSKEQVETHAKTKRATVQSVIKRKLVPINAIMEQHFKARAPDILSIDVEGLDLDILKSLDWSRWRPRVVCVETSQAEDGRVNKDILALLEKQGYTVRGGSFVNTIFLDERTWRAELAAQQDAGR